MDTIGSRIRHLRTFKGLSMEELANQIKVPTKTGMYYGNKPDFENKPISSGTVSNIENDKNKPSADITIALSNFFNVSCDWILTGKEFVYPEINKLQEDGTIILTREQYDASIQRYEEVVDYKNEMDQKYTDVLKYLDKIADQLRGLTSNKEHD